MRVQVEADLPLKHDIDEQSQDCEHRQGCEPLGLSPLLRRADLCYSAVIRDSRKVV